jgi:hypothetical protein
MVKHFLPSSMVVIDEPRRRRLMPRSPRWAFWKRRQVVEVGGHVIVTVVTRGGTGLEARHELASALQALRPAGIELELVFLRADG